MSANSDPLLIVGVGLLAYMMLKRGGPQYIPQAQAGQGGVIPQRPAGPTSMPGSVGSGKYQLAGGILGALAAKIPDWFGSGTGINDSVTSNYVDLPIYTPPAMQDIVPMNGDSIDGSYDWSQYA